jgi:type IV secretion system protein VirB9
VHPAQTNIHTDLHLITSAGHVFSFLLTEVSNEPNAEPDLKLFIEPKEQSGVAGSSSLQGYVRVGEVEAYKKELETLRTQTADQVRVAQAQSAEQVNKFRADYAGKIHFDYQLESRAVREPFLVTAMYHDDAFTYIQCEAKEKPALYELKDGKPNLIGFQVENGVYIVPKIIDTGYLAVGKKVATFSRRAH